MKVDAPGLVAAAQRLITAVEGLGGAAGLAHPPLAPDTASVGAAARLTGASAELAAAVGAHVSALVASAQALTGAALSYVEVDERNAAAITHLNPGAAGGAGPAVVPAPPAPPAPPDVRAPMPPPTGVAPEVIAAALHSGAPEAGESYIEAWSAFAMAARDGAAMLRATAAQLPEWLQGPASTAAVRGHLHGFADGLDTYAQRGHTLVGQARAYASNYVQATEVVPTVQQLATARRNVQTIAMANARSGGALAVPLANATAELTRLSNQAIDGNQLYHHGTDAATASGDPGSGGPGGPTLTIQAKAMAATVPTAPTSAPATPAAITTPVG
nr:PPE domain-containing protein [Mycobacterium intracellulare]